MFGEGLDEFFSCCPQLLEENLAQLLEVEAGGPFQLQLSHVVLDDGCPVVQEEVAGLPDRPSVQISKTHS